MIALSVSCLVAATLAPEHLDAETYSESFTVAAALDDGTYAQLEYAISNIGPGDDHAACRLLIASKGGATWVAEAIVDHPGWSYADEALSIAQCRLTTRGTAQARLGGHSFELVLPRLERLHPPDWRVTDGDDVFEASLLLPFGRASARLDGHDVGATVSVDHFRVTLLPGDLGRYWVRLRALDANGSLLIFGRVLPDGTARGFVWQEGSAIEPLTSLIVAPSGRLAAASQHHRFEIRATTTLQRYAPVEALGIFGHVVRALLGNPVTYRSRAVVAGSSYANDRAVLELTVMDE